MIFTKKRAAGLASLLLVLSLALLFPRIKKGMADFTVNYTAGSRLSWGESLYRVEDGHYQFKYPPAAALLYLPLSLLPLPAAKAVWFALLVLVSGGVFYLIHKLSAGGNKAASWLSWLPLLILGRYFFRELQLGQINALLTFLLLIMTSRLSAAEGRDSPGAERAAGLLWGLSLALKPYALIFLPYLVLKKKVRSLVAGGAVLVIAFLSPALYYGFSGNVAVHKEWVKTLSQSTPQLLRSQDNASLLAMFAKWTGRPDLSVKLWLIGMMVLAAVAYIVFRKGRSLENPVPLDCGLLLLLIPLISPLGWDYTFLSSVLAVGFITRRFYDFSAAARLPLLMVLVIIPLSLYDLMGRKLYAQFMSLSVITVCFLVLVGFVVVLRQKRLC